MANYFHNEIPRARINIQLNVDHTGSQKQHELPLKILCLADYSASNNNEHLVDRERIAINKNNFNQVLEEVSPQLSLSVANKLDDKHKQLSIALQFKHINNFHPEKIVKQVPELNRLLAMRNLLKDLKTNLINNQTFKTELQKLINQQDGIKKLKHELNQLENNQQH